MAETTKPYSPDNPAHVRSRKRRAELDEKSEIEAFRWVMSDARGRQAIHSILVAGGFYSDVFGRDNAHTNYLAGKQAGVHRLYDFIEEQFPKELLLLETERIQKKIDAQVADQAVRTPGVIQTEETDNGGSGDV